MNRGTQWIAVVFSCWLTWAIYVTNTNHASEALTDMVPWIIHVMALISLNTFRMEPEFLSQLAPKTHIIKMWTDVNVLAQVFLLVITGNFWLALLRAGSEALVRYQVDQARDMLGDKNYLRSFQ